MKVAQESFFCNFYFGQVGGYMHYHYHYHYHIQCSILQCNVLQYSVLQCNVLQYIVYDNDNDNDNDKTILVKSNPYFPRFALP